MPRQKVTARHSAKVAGGQYMMNLVWNLVCFHKYITTFFFRFGNYFTRFGGVA